MVTPIFMYVYERHVLIFILCGVAKQLYGITPQTITVLHAMSLRRYVSFLLLASGKSQNTFSFHPLGNSIYIYIYWCCLITYFETIFFVMKNKENKKNAKNIGIG